MKHVCQEELAVLFEEGKAGRQGIMAAQTAAKIVLNVIHPPVQIAPATVHTKYKPVIHISPSLKEQQAHRIKAPRMEVRKQMFGVL